MHYLTHLGVRLICSSNSGVLVQNRADSSLIADVEEKQHMDPTLVELKKLVIDKKTLLFSHKGETEYLITKGGCVFLMLMV